MYIADNEIILKPKSFILNCTLHRLWGDIIVAFRYLKAAHKKSGEGLFAGPWSDRTRRNIFKLTENRFKLDSWERFFTVKMVRP